MTESQQTPPAAVEVPRILAALALRCEPLTQVTPEHTSSQQAVAVLPVMLLELALRILLAPQEKSALLVLPLHLPVMSESQQRPPAAVEVPRILAALALRCEPLTQVTPEHASSQQVASVLPVMLWELTLRILLAPQTKSFALLVLPLHLPSQHKPPELLSVLRMVAALAFKPKPFAQTTLEQVLSQHLMVGMSLRMLLEFALRIW